MNLHRQYEKYKKSNEGPAESTSELKLRSGSRGRAQSFDRASDHLEAADVLATLPAAQTSHHTRVTRSRSDADTPSLSGRGWNASAFQSIRRPDTDYEAVFESMANNSNTISREQFGELCTAELKLDLSSTEIDRVWAQVDVWNNGKMNLQQFLIAVQKHGFLRRIVACCLPETPFQVPADYDYTRSTNDAYANPNSTEFTGKFAAFRQRMDYSYHVNYTVERQQWQDSLIQSVAKRTEKQDHPWVVYTCGPMGAGKGYALSWMSTNGYFPLEHIVHIDPDRFKQMMPEWSGYVGANPKMAGTMCHRESGYLQEIVQEVSMMQCQHVWVDGSLRDGQWFSKIFDELRERFPNYRVAIFFVNTSEEVAWKRCEARAQATGRAVPKDLFLDSLHSPDHVLRMLTPKVDFIARINNDADVPKLEAFESVDVSGSWRAIRKYFVLNNSVKDASSRFPEMLAPIHMHPANESTEDLAVFARMIAEADQAGEQPAGCLRFAAGGAFREYIDEYVGSTGAGGRFAGFKREIQALPEDSRVVVTPLNPIGFPSATRKAAGVPLQAHSMRYFHPVTDRHSEDLEELNHFESPGVAMLRNGAFGWYDLDDQLIGLSEVSSTPQRFLLEFDPPVKLPLIAASLLEERFVELCAELRHAIKCQSPLVECAWVPPGEKIDERRYARFGAFAFLLHDDPAWREASDFAQFPDVWLFGVAGSH